MTNPVNASYVGDEGQLAPLYCTLEEGGNWMRYDGRPYEQCAAIGFPYGEIMVILDLVLLRRPELSTFPVRISPLPSQFPE